MKFLFFIPKFLEIGIVVNWHIPVMPHVGNKVDFLNHLADVYKNTPISMIKSHILRQPHNRHKLRTVGDFFEYVDDRMLPIVKDIDFYGGYSQALTPEGLASIDGIILRIWLADQDDK